MSDIAILQQLRVKATGPCKIGEPGWNETGHENFDRFFDWNGGWAGVMGVRPRANHLARSSSNGKFSPDPRYDHRDSDYLASAD
jgi:hypothetical protein